MQKDILAAALREKWPFFISEKLSKKYCLCIFGNPSGHVASEFLFYSMLIYYLIKTFKLNHLM